MPKKKTDVKEARIGVCLVSDEGGAALDVVRKFNVQTVTEAREQLRKDNGTLSPGRFHLVKFYDVVEIEDVTARKVRFS